MQLKSILSIYSATIFLSLPSQSLSETYSCVYMFGNEPAVVSYKRIGGTFKDLTFEITEPADIIFEDENVVVFSNTYSIIDKPTTYLTIIDKKRNLYSAGGQRIKGRVDTISGSCQRFN